MAAYVDIITTRPDTTAEFWWTNTDATIAGHRASVVNIASQRNLPVTLTVSPDGLTAKIRYTVADETEWQQFTMAVNAGAPAVAAARNAYHQANGHGLKIEVTDTDTNQLVREITLI